MPGLPTNKALLSGVIRDRIISPISFATILPLIGFLTESILEFTLASTVEYSNAKLVFSNLQFTNFKFSI